MEDVRSLSIIENVDLGKLAGMMQKINQFQAVVQQTLKKEHDYGIIAGTNKPTLLKPGAEKILMLMGLTSEYDVIERVQDYENGFFAFTVKCTLLKNGQKITEGVGHCNTKEDKYRYRWVKEQDIPVGVNPENLKSRMNRYGKKEYKIENDEPYTLANTVLKMAKKRAQIDATLTVASLSEIFTQDLEDMKDFLQAEEMENMTGEDAQTFKLTFGKFKGRTLEEIYREKPDYIKWLSEKGNDPVIRKAATELLMLKESAMTQAELEDTPF